VSVLENMESNYMAVWRKVVCRDLWDWADRQVLEGLVRRRIPVLVVLVHQRQRISRTLRRMSAYQLDGHPYSKVTKAKDNLKAKAKCRVDRVALKAKVFMAIGSATASGDRVLEAL